MIDREFQRRLHARQRAAQPELAGQLDYYRIGLAHALGAFAGAPDLDGQLNALGLAAAYLVGYCELANMQFWALLRGSPALDALALRRGEGHALECGALLDRLGSLLRHRAAPIAGMTEEVRDARCMVRAVRSCARRRGADLEQLLPLVASAEWPIRH